MENKYKVGLLLVTLSAATFSTAGLFVKGVSAGSYAIVFWRSIGAIIAIVVYSQYRAELCQEIKDFGPSAFAVSVVGALGTLAFIPAFKLTSIANVSMIYAAGPFLVRLSPTSG